ncbi:MAG: hypothetical protein H7A23_18540 [Leptospiraceae bacterium]|nr:hypothetical protein [Leptospiraceae bacterium]MCP5496550.1 hypothetical protein [Leptospiraceae bacterium]
MDNPLNPTNKDATTNIWGKHPKMRLKSFLNPVIKEQFRNYLNKLTHKWANILSLLCIFLVPLFIILDYFTMASSLFYSFVIYRLLCTFTVFVLYLVLRFTKASDYSFIYGYLFSVSIAGMIITMTKDLGGFDSSYYAGLNLVIIAINLLIPWRPIHSTINGTFILLAYLLVNFFFSNTFNITNLINNIFFMSSTILFSVVVNYLNYQTWKKEFVQRASLEYSQLDDIQKLATAAKTVSQGDLTVNIEIPKSQEQEMNTAITLATSFNTMVNDLRGILSQVISVIKTRSRYSHEMKDLIDDLSRGSKEQIAKTHDASRIIQQIMQDILANSNKASEIANLAKDTLAIALKSETVLESSVEGMDKIDEVVNNSTQKVFELKTSSERISEIIKVIIDIADKTNLLSLNAAIEAARAGDQGKGFGVVANEVRKLAEKTADATQETTSIIKKIQKDIRDSIQSINLITQEVQSARKLVLKISTSMKEIIDVIKKYESMVVEIASAGDDQRSSSQQIFEYNNSIIVVSQGLSSKIEKITSISNNLDQLTESLESDISKFRLN